MKKILIPFTLALMIMVSACSRKEECKVLTKQITYDVVINNQKVISEEGADAASWSWFFNNIEASRRCHFLQNLFERVFTDTLSKDTLKITDDKGVCLTLKQLEQKLFVYDSMDSRPPYGLNDTLFTSTIGPDDIYALRFKEKWTYDPATLKVSKQVLAFAPMYYPNDPARPGKRVNKPVALFWMQQDTSIECTVLLTDKILSNVAFSDPAVTVNPDSSLCYEYMSILSRRVFNDSMPAYMWDNLVRTDLRSHDAMWRAMLLTEKAPHQMDSVTLAKYYSHAYKPYHTVDSIMFTKYGRLKDSIVPGICWKVFFGENNVDKKDPQYKNALYSGVRFGPINGICFVEEWYYDPSTMQLGKKVVQLGALATKHGYRGDIKSFTPSYLVKFNQPVAAVKAKKTVKKEDATKK